jgi:hypothetical protein
MNDENEFDELEAELRQLKPTAPSAELEGKIFSIFDSEEKIVPIATPQHQETIMHWIRPIAAAAAVLALFLGVALLLRGSLGGDVVEKTEPKKAITEIDASFHPVKAGNLIMPPTDEGVIYDENNEPQRSVRYKYHDRYQWIDENGNRIELSVPQERRLLVPIETD